MNVMLNSALKRFDLTGADLEFIFRQVTFQPLDQTGQPIGPPVDASGNPLPGTVTYDPSGSITITATLPGGATRQYTYDSAYDPSGLRHIDGSVNNLLPGQGFFRPGRAAISCMCLARDTAAILGNTSPRRARATAQPIPMQARSIPRRITSARARSPRSQTMRLHPMRSRVTQSCTPSSTTPRGSSARRSARMRRSPRRVSLLRTIRTMARRTSATLRPRRAMHRTAAGSCCSDSSSITGSTS